MCWTTPILAIEDNSAGSNTESNQRAQKPEEEALPYLPIMMEHYKFFTRGYPIEWYGYDRDFVANLCQTNREGDGLIFAELLRANAIHIRSTRKPHNPNLMARYYEERSAATSKRAKLLRKQCKVVRNALKGDLKPGP
jgi:hypothetical protein